jgi:hypothetical protein
MRDRFGQGIHGQVGTVMTGSTVSSCHWPCRPKMTHAPGGESGEGVVTNFALSGRRNVGGRLAERIRPVVAG